MEHSSFYPELLIELYVKLYTTETVWLNVYTSKVNIPFVLKHAT